MKNMIMSIGTLICSFLFASEKVVGTTNVVEDIPTKAVILSCQMRPSDPTVLDVVYRVESDADYVKAYIIAFKDGVRDFDHVLRPETFVEGTETNIGERIAANVEHKISWKVTEDWDINIGKLNVEIFSSAISTNAFVMPYTIRTETRTGEVKYIVKLPDCTMRSELGDNVREQYYPDMLRSTILFWFFAAGDQSLFLKDGTLYWNPNEEECLPLTPLENRIYITYSEGNQYSNGLVKVNYDNVGKYVLGSENGDLLICQKIFASFMEEKFTTFKNKKWEMNYDVVHDNGHNGGSND